VADEEFDGIPLSELPIDEVVWSEERAKHIRTRAERKGPAEISIEPLDRRGPQVAGSVLGRAGR
jgi:hypothetical protein